MKKLDLSLYLVTDSTGRSEGDFLDIIDKACDGGVTLVQLREKDKGGLDYLKLAEKAKRVTDKHNVPLIIDDRVDVAMAVGAAGVHVGQSDLPVYAARELMGADKVVGATAKTVEQAEIAKTQGADYLGVGAIYPTTLKVITVLTEVSTLDAIAARTGLPVVAIGGLNADNMHVLYNSAAGGIAVVSAIMQSADPRAAARVLKAQVLANLRG